jgi:hypothetical protein
MNTTNNEMCKIAKRRQIPLLLPIITATLWFAWSFLSQELMSAHTSILRVQALSIYRTLTHWNCFHRLPSKMSAQHEPRFSRFSTDRIKFRITVLNKRLLLYTQQENVSVQSVSYQRKVGDWFFSELLVMSYKNFHAYSPHGRRHTKHSVPIWANIYMTMVPV